jgi:hypothetical protein
MAGRTTLAKPIKRIQHEEEYKGRQSKRYPLRPGPMTRRLTKLVNRLSIHHNFTYSMLGAWTKDQMSTAITGFFPHCVDISAVHQRLLALQEKHWVLIQTAPDDHFLRCLFPTIYKEIDELVLFASGNYSIAVSTDYERGCQLLEEIYVKYIV